MRGEASHNSQVRASRGRAPARHPPAGPICCRPDTQPVQLHSMGMPPAHCEWRRYANPSRHIDCRRQGTCRMLDTAALPAGSHGENGVCPCTQASAVRQGFGVMHDRPRRRAVAADGHRQTSRLLMQLDVRSLVALYHNTRKTVTTRSRSS